MARTVEEIEERKAIADSIGGQQWFNVKEAEVFCGLADTAGYAMVRTEWKPFVKRIGKRGIRIPKADLIAWMESK